MRHFKVSNTAKNYGIDLLWLIPAVAVVLRIASETTANVSFIIIATYALIGRAEAIRALALCWLFMMLNAGISAEATAASTGRYLILFAATGSVLFHAQSARKGAGNIVLPATAFLGIFLVAHSIFFSPMVDVSVVKAVSWTLAMCTLIAAWSGLLPEERDAIARQLFGSLVVLTLVSLPLLAHPLGYLRNGRGFQGVLNHPQAFGPTMALLGAWAASRMLGDKRPPIHSVALTLVCAVLVVLSQARTAGVAFVMGVSLAALVVPVLSGFTIRRVMPGLSSPRFVFVAAIVIVGTVVAGGRLEIVLKRYISKGTANSTLLEAYDESRGALMDKMWSNIAVKRYQGIGFGIASRAATMEVKRDPLFKLPISAAVEKGVLPLAIWEELGLFGFLIVAGWLLLLLRKISRGGIQPLAVGLTALLQNMGESTFFSPGGFGLLPLLLIAWAVSSGQNSRLPKMASQPRRVRALL